jgi:hypothetical protein
MLREAYRLFKSAESLADQVSLAEFVRDGVFVTGLGDVGCVFEVRAKDAECLDQDRIDAVTEGVEKCFALFDSEWRIYQYLVRRKQRETYSAEIYWAILRCASPIKPLPVSFSAKKTSELSVSKAERLADELEANAAALRYAARELVKLEPCDSFRAFQFLRSLLNFSDESLAPRPLNGVERLSFRCVDSDVHDIGNHLAVGGAFVNGELVGGHRLKILAAKDLPTTTANMLGRLLRIKGQFVACTEWRALDKNKSRDRIKKVRSSEFKDRKSFSDSVAPTQGTQLEDKEKLAAVDDLGGGQVKLYKDHRLGHFSLVTVAFSDSLKDAERTASELACDLNLMGVTMYRETFNALPAYLSIVPGNYKWNFRDDLLPFHTSHADLSFCFGIDTGNPRNEHLNRECVEVLETREGAPFYFNLTHGDVGHTLIVGSTGSGKTFRMNALIDSAQKYAPQTFISDTMGNFEALTRAHKGTYSEFGVRSCDFHINPFAVGEREADFISNFVAMLMECGNSELTTEEKQEIHDSVRDIFVVSPELRTLSYLKAMLPAKLGHRLRMWTNGGKYGWAFDSETDSFELSRFHTFNYSGMAEAHELRKAFTFYVSHKVRRAMFTSPKSELKIAPFDEAWKFMESEDSKADVKEILKTGRNHNACAWVSTQSPVDLFLSGMAETILECCHIKIFLANDGANEDQYIKAFHMNATEAHHVRTMAMKGEMLIKTPTSSKIVKLNVAPDKIRLYSNQDSGGMYAEENSAMRVARV